MENKKIQYEDFYQYFLNTVRINNHWFFTPRNVGMTTCGLNYILKYCSENKTNGVYFVPHEKSADEVIRKRNIDWCGWVVYRKNILKKNDNTIYITSKFDEILNAYKSLKITIFVFDELSFKPIFPENFDFLSDKNVKCVFLESNDEKRLNEVKQFYKNILNDKMLVLHHLKMDYFLNTKILLRKNKIEEIFGDITN